MSLITRLLTGLPDRFPNPLSAGDPDFACRCGVHRNTCRESLQQWRNACGDEPAFTTDPIERVSAVLNSCAKVYDILAKPDWDQLDIIRFAEHYPAALENETFRSLMAGRFLQTELAMRTARRHLVATRSLP